MLQPHASPTPYKAEGLVSEQDIKDAEEKVKNLPVMYAEILGVPTVFINQTGYLDGNPWPGFIGRLIDPKVMRYPGHSAIVEPGNVIARMGNGVVILDLDGDGKEQTGWVLFYLHVDPVGSLQRPKPLAVTANLALCLLHFRSFLSSTPIIAHPSESEHTTDLPSCDFCVA